MSEVARVGQRVRSPLRAISAALKRRPRKAETPAVSLTPTSYRTFSSKIAPALTAIGGALALAGGLGTWIRAERVEDEVLGPERVATVMGYTDPAGVAISALGGVAVLAALLWLTPRTWPKFIPAVAAIAGTSLIAWRLLELVDESEAMAEQARQATDIQFVTFHASLGWGAWTLLVAAILLFSGAGAGLLRELDRRKGVPE